MIKYDTHTPKGANIETSGSLSDILPEVLALISTIYGELERADAEMAALFRAGILVGLLPHGPVWHDPPEGEGVSMLIPMPGKEKGRSNAE